MRTRYEFSRESNFPHGLILNLNYYIPEKKVRPILVPKKNILMKLEKKLFFVKFVQSFWDLFFAPYSTNSYSEFLMMILNDFVKIPKFLTK